MVKAIVGQKLRMTQMFSGDGRSIPLTAIQIGPCPITQIKTEANEGYNALQIAFQPCKIKNVNMPMIGHFKKSKIEPHRFLKEIRTDAIEEFEIGQSIDGSIFEAGDHVDITGVSKGCGFQGGMKRHNWRGGRKTHGSMFHRRIGSIAPGTGQARIFKGKSLPGHMGNKNVTIQNIEVVKVDTENNLLYIRGGIPGPNGGIVFVKQTTKTKTKKSKS